MQIRKKFLKCVALSCTTGYRRDFRPESTFLCFVYDDLYFHPDLPDISLR